MSYSASHGPPPGLKDPKRRTIVNTMVKDKMTFLQYAHETGGTYTRVSMTVEPGGGNPLHFHHTYAEHFHCTDGTLSITLNKNPKIDLPPGESALVPIGANHRFFNATNETIAAEVTLYPGSPGFEIGLYIAYGLACDGLCHPDGVPKSFLHTCVVTKMADITMTGILGALLAVLVNFGAWWARVTGVEDKLVRKYWH